MATRAGYTASTPDATTFPPRYIPIPDDGSEATRLPVTRFSFPASIATSDTASRYLDGLRVFVDNNAGLLLVALAQLFFAFVNVSIKVLKEIDTPIATLQVRSVKSTSALP